MLTATLLLAFAAQAPATGAPISVLPPDPMPGSVVTIVVGGTGRAEALTDVRGRLAGEELHFLRAGGEFRAVAGVPLNADGDVDFPLVLRYSDGRTERVTGTIAVAPENYGADTLQVSSTFSEPQPPELRERIARERQLSRDLTPVAHVTPRLWSGPFVRPLDSPITSGYGRARVYNGAVRSRHMGVDLDGVIGDPVRATNDGLVALVGDFFYSGNVVYLNHGAGLLTSYLHLSRVAVAEGDTVSRGEVIGYVGRSGRVTGPHLHWSARYGSISLNALTLLDVPVLNPPGGTADD